MARFLHQGASEVPPLSRRGFLIGAAGASLAFGFAKPGFAETDATAPVQGAFEPTIWYRIDRDGIVTVNIIRAEMGQHVGTALARILADELEASGIPVVEIAKRRKIDPGFVLRLARFIGKGRFDVMHCFAFSGELWGTLARCLMLAPHRPALISSASISITPDTVWWP